LHTFTAQVEGSILGIGKIFISINILGPGIPGIPVNKFGWIPGNLGIPVVKYIIILTGILLYSETTYKKITTGFRKFRLDSGNSGNSGPEFPE